MGQTCVVGVGGVGDLLEAVDEQEVGVQQALVVWPRWMQLVRMGPYLAVTRKMMKTVPVLLMCWLWVF
jgi:hypothetical protein